MPTAVIDRQAGDVALVGGQLGKERPIDRHDPLPATLAHHPHPPQPISTSARRSPRTSPARSPPSSIASAIARSRWLPRSARNAATSAGPNLSGSQQACRTSLDKLAMSMFIGTPLEMVLRDCGINAFAIVGAVTEIGIEPTVRHGADLGFIPVIVTDACGSVDAAAGERALASLGYARMSLQTDVDTDIQEVRLAWRHSPRCVLRPPLPVGACGHAASARRRPSCPCQHISQKASSKRAARANTIPSRAASATGTGAVRVSSSRPSRATKARKSLPVQFSIQWR
jgi:nicotinamidase-related amidase